MNFKKTGLMIVLGVVSLFSLTACSSFTLENYEASEHRIVEIDNGFWERAWEYEASDGSRQKMEKCENRKWYEQSCFNTLDKNIVFKYSSSKSGISSESITIDGVQKDAGCILRNGWVDNLCGLKAS